MRVANRYRQGVRRIIAGKNSLWQQYLDHVVDLFLFGVTGANNRLLHRVWCIFRDCQPCPRGHKHCNSTCLTKLQGGCRIGIDECVFNGGFIRLMLSDDRHQTIMQLQQTVGEIRLAV